MVPRKHRTEYQGLLVIGDPHLEGRRPGFRCDDYANVILDKLRFCLNYAIEQQLLPVLLGDIFDKPRDNPTWLVGQLIEMMLSIEVVGIYGNHDCAETTLNENDSLSILIKAGCLQLVSEDRMWVGEMNGRPVVIGGSSYRQRVPEAVRLPRRKSLFEESPLVVWLTHHDIAIAGYDGIGRFSPFEIGNVDLLINGHIHRRLPPVQKGRTRWLTPGNISRRSRVDAIRDHVPAVLRIDVLRDDYQLSEITVPHEPADAVFHQTVIHSDEADSPSRFVDGLRELQTRRTDSGAGLHQFLEKNLDQFDPAVAREIRKLASQVTQTEVVDV